MRDDHYTHELAAHRERERDRLARESVAGLDLFGWPERPALVAPAAEQRALPFSGTVAGDYQRWRQSREAGQVFGTMRNIARRWMAERPGTKIGARTLWEAGRRYWLDQNLGAWPDNRLQADACRELEDTTPDLQGHLRFRQRKEAA